MWTAPPPSPRDVRRKTGLMKWYWSFSCLLIVASFGLAYISVINDFYVFGDIGDIGFFSHATWHNNFRLWGPPSYPFSFFNVHIVPLFWLTNLLSYFLPLSKIGYWAALYGSVYALMGFGVFRLWISTDDYAENRWWQFALAATLALATVFSALGVQAVRLPHLEMGIPALALWFFFCLSRRELRAASLFFVLCLAVREDAGLHLFGLIVLLLIVLGRTTQKDLQKALLRYAASALIYSLAALTVKYRFFMAMDNMAIVYSGDPAWQHLTSPLILERLRFLLIHRTFIWIPFLIATTWGLWVRNPVIPLAYIAALPWLIWNLLAVRVNPGHLDFYYAFPFWLALAWPLLALKLWPLKSGGPLKRWPYYALLLASLVGWQDGQLTIYPFAQKTFETGPLTFESNPFGVTEEWGQEKRFKYFTDYFSAHPAAFEQVAMDVPMLGVVMDTNLSVPWFGDWNRLHPGVLPTTLIYFDGGFGWSYFVRPTLDGYPAQYQYFYRIPETKINAVSTVPLEKSFPQPMPFIPVNTPML